jgi:hypothetical protein
MAENRRTIRFFRRQTRKFAAYFNLLEIRVENFLDFKSQTSYFLLVSKQILAPNYSQKSLTSVGLIYLLHFLRTSAAYENTHLHIQKLSEFDVFFPAKFVCKNPLFPKMNKIYESSTFQKALLRKNIFCRLNSAFLFFVADCPRSNDKNLCWQSGIVLSYL